MAARQNSDIYLFIDDALMIIMGYGIPNGFAKIMAKFFVLTDFYAKFDTVMKKEDYIFCLDIDVRDYELDSEGIVNNANYLHYLEWTRHEFCKTTGMSFDDMRRPGIMPVLNRVELE